ncbi:MAG: hypothetical protein D3914_15715 [Candidatus Electrothrix sp. LOE2]|nr:hypothetical protein [Candidatus Electrothrix sp. LOE2]
MKKQPASSATPCRTAERKELLRRAAVPLAAVFCCGMAAADAVSAPCGPGRSLPANTWLMTAPSCSPSPAEVSDQYATDLRNGTYGTDWISFISGIASDILFFPDVTFGELMSS